MDWIFICKEWFLFDNNNVVRAYTYPVSDRWHWIVYDTRGNEVACSGAPTAEDAKNDVKKTMGCEI